MWINERTMKKVFTRRESNLMSFVLCYRKIVYLFVFLVFTEECFSQTVVDEGSNLNLRCPINESLNGDWLVCWTTCCSTLLVCAECANDCDILDCDQPCLVYCVGFGFKPIFLLMTEQPLKNGTCFKGGQKWSKNNSVSWVHDFWHTRYEFVTYAVWNIIFNTTEE